MNFSSLYWTCSCGAENAVIDKTCRNCKEQRILVEWKEELPTEERNIYVVHA